jgi:hypothetical protein
LQNEAVENAEEYKPIEDVEEYKPMEEKPEEELEYNPP